ncbi:unnamed protein product [Amoebophrya sp. A120]|nr:unnamed protein product [Amoebophrya sp. A120]|eukprot:GSA120T00008514001.1
MSGEACGEYANKASAKRQREVLALSLGAYQSPPSGLRSDGNAPPYSASAGAGLRGNQWRRAALACVSLGASRPSLVSVWPRRPRALCLCPRARPAGPPARPPCPGAGGIGMASAGAVAPAAQPCQGARHGREPRPRVGGPDLCTHLVFRRSSSSARYFATRQSPGMSAVNRSAPARLGEARVRAPRGARVEEVEIYHCLVQLCQSNRGR